MTSNEVRERKSASARFKRLGLSGGVHAVDCEGEAHSNPFIDNCMRCAPLWGRVILPIEHETPEQFHEFANGGK